LGWPGVTLPATVLLGCRVVPVVELDHDAHHRRLSTADGAQLDSDVLAMWEWPEAAGQAPPPALQLVGVLLRARAGWRAALAEAQSWRGFGPVAVLVAPETASNELCHLEFSVHGIGLALDLVEDQQAHDRDHVLITGAEPGRCVGARRRTADRWIEEVLYQHAIDQGHYLPM